MAPLDGQPASELAAAAAGGLLTGRKQSGGGPGVLTTGSSPSRANKLAANLAGWAAVALLTVNGAHLVQWRSFFN